jgi:hypothetical protein
VTRNESRFVVILAKTFAAFVDRPIWQQELEGFNVITSPIFDEIRNEARNEGLKRDATEVAAAFASVRLW